MTTSYELGDLSQTGLLWLINDLVLHPAGLEFRLECDESGAVVGWQVGDEVTEFPAEINATKAAALEAFIAKHAPQKPASVSELEAKLNAALAENRQLRLISSEPTHVPPVIGLMAPVSDIRDVRNVLLDRPRFSRDSFAASYKDEATANVAGGG